MNITSYIHVIYAVIVWGFALIFIKPKRIKELLPISILAMIILFVAEYFLISLNLYRFNSPMLPIGGIPLFHLIWGAGSGIVVLHYMKKGFTEKVVLIIFFTIVTLAFEYIAESIGAASHLGNFNEIHDAFEDLIILIALVWISEGLWGNRIHSNVPSK